ncbi:BspA family leucine-rich repeat surface protein [Xylocopilactobacillus apicola]|uniref:Surface protein n=1 Tax=Xylocopilactobacillus apicola TaxID=2932184 RepID=A0AAU9D6Q5_9LACO|nr:BspA family leucine-rich repeat surface protein [Xylocopilactobacillus apicola]BDR59233.1 hypothetical protein XA3_16740 [Xylocopilactobacillus apicola]
MVAFTGGGDLVNQKKKTNIFQPRLNIQPRDMSTVVSTGDFRLNAESKFEDGQSYVVLDWDPVVDVSDGYLVERTTDGANWMVPPTNYGKKIKILNVYPGSNNFLKSWMDQVDPNTGQPVSMGLIEVDPVSIDSFNVTPDSYLKDDNGNYKYDGIYFGSADNNDGKDLVDASVLATQRFGDTGRSVIFGHDTMFSYHTQFSRLALNLNLKLFSNFAGGVNDDRVGSTVVKFTEKMKLGYLTQFPYKLDPNAEFHIGFSHNSGQYYQYGSDTQRWMEYLPPFGVFAPSEHYLDANGVPVLGNSGDRTGDNNWYLVTKNNYSMIQTGHSTGSCSSDEAKIIANMVYFTSTLNVLPHGEDHTVKDSAAPDTPDLSLTSQNTDQINLNINSTDNKTDYYYRVKAKTPTITKYSDHVKVPVISGLKGYVYSLDDDPAGEPEITKDPTTGNITNINLNPNSNTDNQAPLTVNRSNGAGKYLHIVAVDNANNVSGTKTINLSDYFWWDYKAATKALTIYSHALNFDNDTQTGSNGLKEWPWWSSYRTLIEKVVIKPGVSSVNKLDNLFVDLNALVSIEGMENLNTDQTTSMQSFLKNCTSLKNIDVSRLGTSALTNTSEMFYNCRALEVLDLRNFDLRNVSNSSNMFWSTPSLWQLILGENTKLNSDAALANPAVETEIVDAGVTYYVTNPQWREIGSGGTVHDPKGLSQTAAQIISDSATATGIRIYVWDQQGKQTLATTGNIDFGTHRGSIREHDYMSTAQEFNITDNRNARSGKSWRIEGAVTKQFELANDTTKKISGNPIYYQSNGATTNLTSTAQTLYSGTGGSGYQDILAIPWTMSFKSQASTIPVPGQYKATITYTLVNVP